MLKDLILNILICISIFSDPFITINPVRSEHNPINQLEKYSLVASLPEENISLFVYDTKSSDSYMYNRFLLNVNGKTAIFDWKNEKAPASYPELFVADINNDKAKELIVVLTIGSGTGLRKTVVHVLRLSDFIEISVVNPLSIIKDKVQTSIIKNNNGKILITINVDNKKNEIAKDENYAPVWFENVGFGSKIYWSVRNNKLYADVPAQITPASFVGTVTIEYCFEKNILNMGKIEFTLEN